MEKKMADHAETARMVKIAREANNLMVLWMTAPLHGPDREKVVKVQPTIIEIVEVWRDIITRGLQLDETDAALYFSWLLENVKDFKEEYDECVVPIK